MDTVIDIKYCCKQTRYKEIKKYYNCHSSTRQQIRDQQCKHCIGTQKGQLLADFPAAVAAAAAATALLPCLATYKKYIQREGSVLQ